MHLNSLDLMRRLFEAYAPVGNGRTLYDVGSYDVNGNYCSIVKRFGWHYMGLDIMSGANVDIVIAAVGDGQSQGLRLRDLAPVDLIISGQCIEHVIFPWDFVAEIAQALLPNGFLFLIAPFMWEQHRHPIDCWRFLPDGMRALAAYAQLDMIDTGLLPTPERPVDNIDCWAVMRRR